MTYWKIVDSDLRSFHDPAYQYRIGGTHRPTVRGTDQELCTEGWLYASDDPHQVYVVGRWPWRLLRVEGKPVFGGDHKFAFRQLRVVAEDDVALSFGPNGAAVLAVVRRCERLTRDDFGRLAAARVPARAAAGVAAGVAARVAARAAARAAARVPARAAAGVAAGVAARVAARAAAWDAAGAAAGVTAWATAVADLVGQHGLTQTHLDTIRRPWLDAGLEPVWETT